MSTKKIVLTPRQEAWLCRHFRNTRNAELAARLGISETSLHRFARSLGLTKTPQFMRKCQAATAAAAKASHLRNGTYPPKGYHIARGSMICRYDQNTRRSRAMESRKQGDPHFIAWKFLPVEQ